MTEGNEFCIRIALKRCVENTDCYFEYGRFILCLGEPLRALVLF